MSDEDCVFRGDSGLSTVVTSVRPPGPPGPTGPAGPAGPQGATGVGQKGDPGNYLAFAPTGYVQSVGDLPTIAALHAVYGVLDNGHFYIAMAANPTAAQWFDMGGIVGNTFEGNNWPRAAFVAMNAALPGFGLPEGHIVWLDGIAYKRVVGSTVIPDLHEWEAAGVWHLEHFGAIGDATDTLEGSDWRYISHPGFDDDGEMRPDWEAGVQYNVKHRVQAPANRRGYMCVTSHVSTTWAADLAAGYWIAGYFTGTDGRAALEIALQAGIVPELQMGCNYRIMEHPNNIAVPGTPFLNLQSIKDIVVVGAPGAKLFFDEDIEYRLENDVLTVSYLFDTGVFGNDETTPGKRRRGKYGKFHLKNLEIRGRWTHYPGSRGARSINGPNGQGHCIMRVRGYSDLDVDGCKFTDIRQRVSANEVNARASYTNNHLIRCGKDGFRELNSLHTRATGNQFDYVADDCIAFINIEEKAGSLYDGSFAAELGAAFSIVSDNGFFQTESIFMLGAQYFVCNNNIFDICFSAPLSVSHTTINNRAQIGMEMTGNIVSNTIMPFDAEVGGLLTSAPYKMPAIRVRAGTATSSGTSGILPGTYNPATGGILSARAASIDGSLWHTKRGDQGSAPPTFGFAVDRNQVLTTLPSGVPFVKWKRGWLFDSTGFYNPIVEDVNRPVAGIEYSADVLAGSVDENFVMGTPLGIVIQDTSSVDRPMAMQNFSVSRNKIYDTPLGGIQFRPLNGGVPLSWSGEVNDNLIDVDPEFRSIYRKTGPIDGSWVEPPTVLDWPAGIFARNQHNLRMSRNRIRNAYMPIVTNEPGLPSNVLILQNDNIVECDPVSPDYNAGNKGVGCPGLGNIYTHVIVDSNPRNGDNTPNANYRAVKTTPDVTQDAMPASGTYVAGWFVRKTIIGALVSGKRLMGWLRLTTGSGHVLGTDWEPVYAVVA